LLLLAAFAGIWRCFGLRTLCISLVIFGANDFVMFGTNWAGSTLRHDWMAYLALGACALELRRFALAGALFALSTSIRAFPVLALAGLVIPALWWAVAERREHGKLPSWRALVRDQAPVLRALVAAGVTFMLLFCVTSLLFSPHAWSEWAAKVDRLSIDPHANHIGLRSLIAGSDSEQARVLENRYALYLLALAAYVALVVLACRGKRPAQGAMLALILIPVLFYPANYYIHFIFLLPLIATERVQRPGDGAPANDARQGVFVWVWLPLLLLCAAQYFTVHTADLMVHFQSAGLLLFAALTFLLVSILRADGTLYGAEAKPPVSLSTPPARE
jgi:hypothetical protein